MGLRSLSPNPHIRARFGCCSTTSLYVPCLVSRSLAALNRPNQLLAMATRRQGKVPNSRVFPPCRLVDSRDRLQLCLVWRWARGGVYRR